MMKEVELGSVCYFENGDRGKNYPSQSAFVEKGIPFINAGNLENELIKQDDLNYITEERYNLLGSGKLQPNDILFCLRGSLGKFAINKDGIKGAIASSLVLLRAKDDLDINYLKHYLKSDRLKLLVIKSDNGSSQPNLSGANVKKFPIPLPPLPQQKKIAAILDAADTYRQKTKALIAKYDELAQSLFLDMFGDPVTNPKGWAKNSLSSVTSKIGSGATPKGGKDSYKTIGISLIRSLNVHDNEFKYKDLAFIDDNQAEKLNNVIIEKKDVLFNITGASVCRCCIVPDEVIPARVNQHVSILRPFKEKLNSYFLMFCLISENVKQSLLGIGTQGGATREAITKSDLENFELIVPSVEQQNHFADRVQAIEAQKAQAQASLAKAEDLFNSLLQRAFKGELTS